MSATDYLSQGIAAAKAGKKNTARNLLSQAVRIDPTSESAWLWLSSILDTTQGRLYCLQKVLQINPTNRLAQKGILALGKVEPAPAPTSEPEPTEPSKAIAAAATLVEPIEPVQPTEPTTTEPEIEDQPARDPATTLVEELRSSLEPASRPPSPPPVRTREQEVYWKIIIGGLAAIALCLVVLLAYVILGRPTAARGAEMAMVIVTDQPSPRGTLRPTFTPSPTATPSNTPTLVPTLTSVPTHTPLPLPTDTPTPTLTPTFTPTPRPARRAPPTATPTPRSTLPPRSWDTRLNPLGVRIEAAGVPSGKPHWRLVDARWMNEKESEGRHSIYVEVQDIHGTRVVGQPVVVQWPGSAVSLATEDRPAPEYGVNFPMYATLGGYAVSVGGAPSDKVVGLGLGTAASPAFTIHTSFYLTFRWVH